MFVEGVYTGQEPDCRTVLSKARVLIARWYYNLLLNGMLQRKLLISLNASGEQNCVQRPFSVTVVVLYQNEKDHEN